MVLSFVVRIFERFIFGCRSVQRARVQMFQGMRKLPKSFEILQNFADGSYFGALRTFCTRSARKSISRSRGGILPRKKLFFSEGKLKYRWCLCTTRSLALQVCLLRICLFLFSCSKKLLLKISSWWPFLMFSKELLWISSASLTLGERETIRCLHFLRTISGSMNSPFGKERKSKVKYLSSSLFFFFF